MKEPVLVTVQVASVGLAVEVSALRVMVTFASTWNQLILSNFLRRVHFYLYQ